MAQENPVEILRNKTDFWFCSHPLWALPPDGVTWTLTSAKGCMKGGGRRELWGVIYLLVTFLK